MKQRLEARMAGWWRGGAVNPRAQRLPRAAVLRYALGACVLVAALTARTANADSAKRPRIVIVMDVDCATLATRIAAELNTMGFEAVARTTGRSVQELPTITREAGAIAGAKILVMDQKVGVWLLDRTTGKTLMRELARPPWTEEARLALHAVELLRASLLELQLPDAPRGEVEASPSLLDAARVRLHPTESKELARPDVGPNSPAAAAAVVRRAPARESQASEPQNPQPLVAVEVAPALVDGMGNLKPFPSLMVGTALFVSPELRLGALGFLPLAGTHFSSEVGSSENRITLFGVEARWQRARGRLRPFACLGAVLAHLQTRGETRGFLLEGRSDSATTFGALLRLGLGLEVSSSLRLSPQGMTGIQHRYFALDFVDTTVASWGPLWWAGALALEGEFE